MSIWKASPSYSFHEDISAPGGSSEKTMVAYFKGIAIDLGMPYQNLINLYLRDCTIDHKKVELKWAS